jgi:hypothetical protein
LPVVADVSALAGDSDKSVAFTAVWALWRIDAHAAADAAAWRPIPEDEWGFTAIMPAEVNLEKREDPLAKGKATWHSYGTYDDLNRYMISVGQFPEGSIGAMPPEKRLELLRNSALTASARQGALVEKEESIEVQGRKGKQLHIKLDENLHMRMRVFNEGDRVFMIWVQTNDALPKEQAADYFLDSFRFAEEK